jgi:DUF2075 family protein
VFPVVFDRFDNIDNMVNTLRNEYYSTYFETPGFAQVNAWKSSLIALKDAGINYPLLAEFPIFDLERADFLVVGKQKVLIIEAKGWHKVKKINDYSVLADDKLEQDPCYQLNNYLSKFIRCHSASAKYEFTGALFTYNSSTYRDSCMVVTNSKQLGELTSTLGQPAEVSDLNQIIDGKFVITQSLIELVKKNKEELLHKAASTLLSTGYGLTSEQTKILENVLESLQKGEGRVLLVRGESGSGKTLLALTLLLEAVSRGYKALLGYRNNRLLNTLRNVLSINRGAVNLSSLITYYSTGPPSFRGIGEPNFPLNKYGELDLAIFDEAQRMTASVSSLSMTRAKVSVYFYDESQMLIGDESGTREQFLKDAMNALEFNLSSPYRAPALYLKFVKNLLEGKKAKVGNYGFRVFDDIKKMLDELDSKSKEGYKVALTAAYTESDGDRKKPDSIRNVRIGYPLQSGFELYKGLDLKIKWLMDEKNEYPKYWQGLMDTLKYCASVYGAQGFEADYVGVVWGRDFVREGTTWMVNPNVITDGVGNNNSLKNIARRDRMMAERLLKNRYYILLTRGIRGTYVFFEDPGTREFVSEFT